MGPDDAELRRAAHERGRAAELRVAAALIAAGWSIRRVNWRGGGGELDLVAEREGCRRFVEVKLREAGDPLRDEAIPDWKRARLRQAALAWEAIHGEPAVEVCFLVAFVDGESGAVELVDDAFDG